MNCQNPSPGRPSARLPLSLPVLCAVADNARQKAICHPRSRGPLPQQTFKKPPLPHYPISSTNNSTKHRRGAPWIERKRFISSTNNSTKHRRGAPWIERKRFKQKLRVVRGERNFQGPCSGDGERGDAHWGGPPQESMWRRPMALTRGAQSRKAVCTEVGPLTSPLPNRCSKQIASDSTWTI